MLVFASVCVIAVLGGLLKAIRIPPGEKWKNLRAARNNLALSCFILAALSVLNFLMQGYGKSPSVQDILVLLIASSQALLFTMTLLTFIQPLYVRKERVIPQIAAIVAAGVLLLLFLFLWEPVFPVIFYAAIVSFLFQLAYYTFLFNKKYTLCLRQLEEYYDEDEDNRLQWVKTSFYTALSIGVTALWILFFKGWVYDVFIIVYTAFYVYMACRFSTTGITT
jgi:hypothetical protein